MGGKHRILPDNIAPVTSAGAVSLPSAVRDRLGIKQGERAYVQFLKTDDGYKIVPVELAFRAKAVR